MPENSPPKARPVQKAQNKIKIFFLYSVYGWLACTAVCIVLNAIPLFSDSGWRFEALFMAAIMVLFLNLPIILPVGISLGLLAVLVKWFLNCNGRTNFRRYILAFIVSELAGIIMLPAWSSALELIAEGAPPALVAKSEFLQRIRKEHAEEREQVDSCVCSRPSVRPGSCLFGPDYWAKGPDDIKYIDLLKSLKQLHLLRRCIDFSAVPLLLFPYTVLFALCWIDLRRRVSEKAWPLP